MQGYNVLYPMGWDAFGLPTENFAIKNKIHPRVVTKNPKSSNLCRRTAKYILLKFYHTEGFCQVEGLFVIVMALFCAAETLRGNMVPRMKCALKILINAVKRVYVKKIAIRGRNQMYVGDSIQLTTLLSPDKVTESEILWKSDHKKIASYLLR